VNIGIHGFLNSDRWFAFYAEQQSKHTIKYVEPTNRGKGFDIIIVIDREDLTDLELLMIRYAEYITKDTKFVRVIASSEGQEGVESESEEMTTIRLDELKFDTQNILLKLKELDIFRTTIESE
jgi:hypothetical protein